MASLDWALKKNAGHKEVAGKDEWLLAWIPSLAVADACSLAILKPLQPPTLKAHNKF